VSAAVLAVLLAAAAGAQPLQQERMLRDGNWNQRIHATSSLGALGERGLPLLSYAAHDADWQVRMTAAHEMGRVGRPALKLLETVLREEPCRHVRLTAVHWLGVLGPEASDALRRSLGDESAMVRLMGRYWLKKQNAQSPPAEAPEETAASEEDLKACAASASPGRAPWATGEALPSLAGADEPQLEERVITKDPEILPSTAATPARPAPPPGDAEYAKLGRERLKELDELLAPAERGTPETLPKGAPGFGERPAPETKGADFMTDAGTAKLENDPLPALLAYLKAPDAAKRARAADELGRRGTPEATAALTATLKDKAPRVRASAAIALGNIGAAADAAVPALVAALKRGPEEVTWSAALALGRIGTPRARRAFARHSRESAGEFVKTKR
jgi:HEAT repeat protein